MKKVVIFDLDGTLVNSLEDLAISVNFALETVGLPCHPVEAYKSFVGDGREMLIRRSMGEYAEDKELFDKVSNLYNSHYNAHCNDNTTDYDGCSQMLSALEEKNIKTAVLSNKPDEFVLPIINKVYPNHKFACCWGKKAEFKPKPDGQSLNAILDMLSISSDECLYVGDSNVDVFTAENAGVDMCGVEWGFRGREELIKAGAKTVIKKPMELLSVLGD